MTKVSQKLSFAEMTEEVDAQKNNSDLSNLAHALQYLRAGRKALETYIAKQTKIMDDLEAEIKKTASEVESGELVEYGIVHKLYEQSRKVGPSL
jgi:peptidoglycan hydrolase CwlO-like protein